MTKELSRKELYDLVWSKPMSTIALEYGLSDRGLAKLCARNSIPVPPRGYWARKDAGQPVQQPVFHPTPKGKPDRVAIHGNPLPPEVKAILQEENKRRQAIPPVEVKPLEPSETPHWAVLATAKALRKARPDKENVVHALNNNHCGISVGVTCVERVISILDVLCCRLEERGLALNPLGKSMGVALDADSIEFSVVENIEKRKHIPTADELAREEAIKKKAEKNRGYPDGSYLNPERAYPEFDYIRTGKISVQIAPQYTSVHIRRCARIKRASNTGTMSAGKLWWAANSKAASLSASPRTRSKPWFWMPCLRR